MCAEHRHHGQHRQRGQALAEALLACVVLAALMLLVSLLGRYQSIQQATVAASRTLAFECTVRIEACREPAAQPLLDEIRRRHFMRTDGSIASNDRAAGPAEAPERNALWVDRRNRALLARYDDVGIALERESFDAGLSVAVGNAHLPGLQAATLLTAQAGPGRFGFDIEDGLFRARVQANLVPRLPETRLTRELDALALRPRAQAAILADAWNASGPYGSDSRSVEQRVERGQRLAGALETGFDLAYLPIRGYLELMWGLMLEPTAHRFDYHHIDVDRVPDDRIGR